MRLNYYICVVGEPWDKLELIGKSEERGSRILWASNGREEKVLAKAR